MWWEETVRIILKFRRIHRIRANIKRDLRNMRKKKLIIVWTIIITWFSDTNNRWRRAKKKKLSTRRHTSRLVICTFFIFTVIRTTYKRRETDHNHIRIISKSQLREYYCYYSYILIRRCCYAEHVLSIYLRRILFHFFFLYAHAKKKQFFQFNTYIARIYYYNY